MDGGAYKRYVLSALTVVYTLNYLDSNLMTLFLQPIKEDLRLSDTQLGFVTGIAFGLFYATMGVPIARWADRGNRSTITSIAIGLWGLTVMSCVFVTNFVQLVCARIAAGIGESGCLPPTYSLVGDYFPKPAERTRAMAVYMLANPLSALTSFVLGGWLNDAYGWRKTFFLMGFPALAVAVLVRLTVRDPRFGKDSTPLRAPARVAMADVLRALWRRSSSRHLVFALILVLTIGAGLGPWFAAFMMRSHAMQTSELGIWFGIIFGGSGICGILLGSQLLTRWVGDDESAQLRWTAAIIAGIVPCFLLFLLVPGKHAALVSLTVLMIVFNLFIGPTFALLQRLFEDGMRATALAVVMLLVNLFGAGLGPQLVGALSDELEPLLGGESLRYAMLSMSFVAFWASAHFWRAARTVRTDLAQVEHVVRKWKTT